MATRTREGVPGKEKRGTSPLTVAEAVQRRRSSNPSKATSPVRSPDSAATEKHVPNYLKPTVCSGLDASKQQGKKPFSSPDKPVLGRRRSFDKPPSASAARISPNPIRASSFSGKTVASLKGISDKNSRGSKDAAGKQQHGLYARPVTAVKKTSTTNVRKKEIVSASNTTTTEQVSSPTEKMDVSSVTDVSETETLSENQESPVAECEQQGIVQIGERDEEGGKDCEVEVQESGIKDSLVEEDKQNGASDSVMEDGENGAKDLKASNLEEEEESIKFEQSEEAEEKDNTDDANKMMTTESCLEIQEAKIVSIDTWSTAEDHQETESNSIVSVKTEDQDYHNLHVEEPKEPTTHETNKSDTEESNLGIQQREGVTDINEAEESKEMEVEKEVVEENPIPPEAEPGSSKSQAMQRKKDATVVPNDVIEETAKQLRDQRKNKVKALAGAFETVISLQEHK